MTRTQNKTAQWYRENFEIGSADLDVIIGKNVRSVREKLNISQTALGAEIGVSYQQIQKIEKGMNRITASQLYVLAQILKTPLDAFFQLPEDSENQ